MARKHIHDGTTVAPSQEQGQNNVAASSTVNNDKNAHSNATIENVTSGQAGTNSAASTTEKSKKRKRKEGEPETVQEGNNEAEGQDTSTILKEKKKKKSKKNKDAGGATDTQTASTEESVANGNADGLQQNAQGTEEESSTRKKGKKSKKDKSRANEQANDVSGEVEEGSSSMQIDTDLPTTVTSTTAENGGEIDAEGKKKKKKKRKDKDGNSNEEDDAEKKRRKKEKKEKKAAAIAAAEASTSTSVPAYQNSLQSGTASTRRRASASPSPLPEIRVPPSQSTIPSGQSTNVQVRSPDFENIDPALWSAPAQQTASGAVRGGSTPGFATSILPRDPSMPPSGSSAPIAPPRSSAAPRGESITPSTVPPDDGTASTAPRKRGRPKKVVSEAGIIPSSILSTSNATQAIAPAPVASTANAGRSSIAPSARPPTASSITPSLAPPSTSSSPRRPATGLPPSTSASAPAPASSSARQQTQTQAQRLPLPNAPQSTASFPHLLAGVNPNTAARAAMNPNFVPATLPEGITPLQPSENTLEHQEMLAEKWLSTKDMAELIEKKGLKVRTGKFSKAEDAALKLCIENYRQQQGLTEEQIDGIIFAKGRNTRADYGDFWTIITRSIPDRALMSVYHHTKRLMQVEARKGPWTEEEDEKLKQAYKQFGPKWIKISTIVGRWENDCRDRWRSYTGPNEKILKGKWSKEEEDKLRDIIKELKYEIYKFKKENEKLNGQPIEDEPPGGSDMFWSKVASKMKTRSRHQCRIKWNDNMRNRLLTSDGKPIRWSKRDTFILIMKLDSLQLVDEDDIAWKLLPDSHWNWWSPHVLHKRWGSMKARAKRHLKNEEASYKEIITWLKKEQDSIPRKEVKAFMAKRPGEGDDEDENAGDEDNENGGDDDNGGDDEDGDGEDVDDAPPRQQRKQQTGSVSAAASKDIASSAASAADTSSVARAKKKGANGKDQSQFRTNEFINSSDEED